MNNPDKRVRLRVLGLSYTQVRNGAYMLILQQEGGPFHLNMWISEGPAQSIAACMERVSTPRPFVHELFTRMAHGYGIRLQEVFIYKVDDDIFTCELTFTDGERQVKLDARTSDAIAIAMRVDAPIYTTRAILEDKGFFLEVQDSTPGEDGDDEDGDSDGSGKGGSPGSLENFSEIDDSDMLPYSDDDDDEDDEDDDEEGGDADNEEPLPPALDTALLERYAIEELERTLARLIDQERYEEAARVNEILQRKRGS